jgi:hypothetical protein
VRRAEGAAGCWSGSCLDIYWALAARHCDFKRNADFRHHFFNLQKP